MAKHGRSGTMQVLLNGRLVGALRLAGSGAISLTYDHDWLSWEHAMPISQSLPLREGAHQGGPVIAYLENLLPDNQAIRERVAARVRAGGTDAWHMLEKIGRDWTSTFQQQHSTSLRLVPSCGVNYDVRRRNERGRNLGLQKLIN